MSVKVYDFLFRWGWSDSEILMFKNCQTVKNLSNCQLVKQNRGREAATHIPKQTTTIMSAQFDRSPSEIVSKEGTNSDEEGNVIASAEVCLYSSLLSPFS